MATKAEARRAEEERHGLTPKAKRRASAKKTRTEKLGAPHAARRASRKASYALEAPSKKGRVSRKSTRASANRAKPDSNLNRREERVKGSPQNRARKARARRTRVRGASATNVAS